MNIVTKTDSNIVKTDDQLKAYHAVMTPSQFFRYTKNMYKGIVMTIFKNDTTANIFTEMGTDGNEAMLFIEKIKNLLQDLQPGCTEDIDSYIKPYTKNPDGTATLD